MKSLNMMSSSFIRHYWADSALSPPCVESVGGMQASQSGAIVSFGGHDFWGYWHHSWRHFGMDDQNQSASQAISPYGKVEPSGVPSSPVDAGVQFRPEAHPAPAIALHPVDDAGDFVITLDDEAEADNDLGVSFARWQDIVDLVDLPLLFLAETIPFITFGLRNVPLGRRDFTSPDLSPSRLRELIWHLWQDEVQQFEDVIIHFVRPQPLRELGCPRAIVLIIEILTEDTMPGMSPFLAITCDPHDRLLDTPQAQYSPQVADTSALGRHCALSYLCAPRGFRRCHVLVTGVVSTGQVVVAPGALVKWVVSSKLQIFARAIWFPDIERFAAHVRDSVRAGFQEHTLEILMPSQATSILRFRLADVFRPGDLRQMIAQVCGHHEFVLYPIRDDALSWAAANQGSHFYAMVIPEALAGVAFVTVTQVLDAAGVVISSYHQVVFRDEHADLPHLHRYLCHRLQIDSTLPWQFQCAQCDVTTLHSVAFASVIVHTVFPSRSVGIYARQIGIDDDTSPQEYSEDSVSTDSLSLLQVQAVRGRRLLLLQHDTPPVQVEVLPAVEDVERSHIALQLPHRFLTPMAWLDRRSYEIESPRVDIEILVDPFRPLGTVDVLCECLHLDDHGLVLQTLRILRIPRCCSWPCLVRALHTQLGVPTSHIEAASFDNAPCFHDTTSTVADGAHCRVIISEALVGDFPHLTEVAMWRPVDGCTSLSTYIVDLPQLPSRNDLVGQGALEPLMALFKSRPTWPQLVRLHRVRWDPNDLEPCRKLFLLACAPEDASHVPMLVFLKINDTQQAWQICYLPHSMQC